MEPTQNQELIKPDKIIFSSDPSLMIIASYSTVDV
jgi:hypothetical protein